MQISYLIAKSYCFDFRERRIITYLFLMVIMASSNKKSFLVVQIDGNCQHFVFRALPP